VIEMPGPDSGQECTLIFGELCVLVGGDVSSGELG
jgi:hypothetical protein